jgi:hypothetical protein
VLVLAAFSIWLPVMTWQLSPRRTGKASRELRRR